MVWDVDMEEKNSCNSDICKKERDCISSTTWKCSRMHCISRSEKESGCLYPGKDMNMENVISESILNVETPVDVPLHRVRQCNNPNSAEVIHCEDTKDIGLPSSSVRMNDVPLFLKEKSLPGIETEPMTQVFVPESECFVEKSELCIEEISPLHNDSANIIRNARQIESESSVSHTQSTIFEIPGSVYNVQNAAEIKLEPIAQVFVAESEYYLEKSELCKEERTLLDNAGANYSRNGSNMDLQSSFQCMEPVLLGVHKPACDVATVAEIKVEHMTEDLVSDGEYLLKKNEFSKKETSLTDNDNVHFHSGICNVETHVFFTYATSIIGNTKIST